MSTLFVLASAVTIAAYFLIQAQVRTLEDLRIIRDWSLIFIPLCGWLAFKLFKYAVDTKKLERLMLVVAGLVTSGFFIYMAITFTLLVIYA